MKKPGAKTVILALAGAAALSLGGCAHRYHDGYAASVAGPGYDVWYDGYYGPYYGGYWGPDGVFYYQDSTLHYHRGDTVHFRHHQHSGYHGYRGHAAPHDDHH